MLGANSEAKVTANRGEGEGMRLKFLAVVIVITVLSGCGMPNPHPETLARIAEITARLVYSKDPRTGICYATNVYESYGRMTYVPCAPEVERLLIK